MFDFLYELSGKAMPKKMILIVCGKNQKLWLKRSLSLIIIDKWTKDVVCFEWFY